MTMAETEVGDSPFVNDYPTLIDFETRFRRKSKPSPSLASKAKHVIKNGVKNFDLKQSLLTTFPIVGTVCTYDVKGDLLSDVIAGVMAGVTLIPQSMAFATLSTLPHYVGLYMSFFSPLTYFIFGTSRHLAWGCVAIVSLMMADIMSKYDKSHEASAFITRWNASIIPHLNISSPQQHDQDSNSYQHTISSLNPNWNNSTSDILEKAMADRRIEVASSVTVISGFVCIIASFIGFHRISTVMSNSLMTGFTVGISFHIATSQVKAILGLSIERYTGTARIFRTWVAIFEHISDTQKTALVISLVCMLVIYLVKKCVNERYKHRMRVPIPVELFVVLGGIGLSYCMDYIANHKVKVVGKVPSGMPTPKLPDLSLGVDYIGDGLVIVLVSYAQTLAMAKTMALEYDYGIDPQQEMLATGLCSTICGFFLGYIPSGSVSISLVQSSSGGKSRVASLFSATIVLLVILVLGRYVKYLPTCVMAAIILVNLKSMFSKFLRLPSEWRTSKYDCVVWMFSCAVTIILDTGLALLVSVAFSLLLVMFRSMVRPVYEIGQIKLDTSSVELRSSDNYDCIKKMASVKLIKIKTPVLFFNADILVSSIISQTKVDPTRLKSLLNSKSWNKSNGSSMMYESLDERRFESTLDLDNNESLPVLAVKAIVLDISEVAMVDRMGVQALDTVIREFSSVNVDVFIASVPENLFDILQSTGFWKKHQNRLYLNVPAALASLPATVQKYDGCKETNLYKSMESLY